MLSLRSTHLTGVSLENARTARAEDSKELEKLASKANEEMIEKRGGPTLDLLNPYRGDLSSMLFEAFESEDSEIVVGTIDEVIVGFGIAETYELQDGAPHVSIKSLYVEEGARSVGVGEAIMEEILSWANSRKAKAIDAVALPGDRATKNFFETHGLVARAIIVQKTLSE